MRKEKDYIYICGHRHPDTDSIVSALAYAHLKRELGIPAIACRLGEMNDESEYLLSRFKVEQPTLLKDSRATIDESDMDEAVKIHLDASIKDAMELVTNKKRTLAVVDDRDQLVGLITNSNLSFVAMGDTSHTIELLKRTSVDNIVRAINGDCVYKPPVFHFNGKVSIIAISEDSLNNYDLRQRLVILGNDTQAQLLAIEKGAACIVTVWTDEIAEDVIESAKIHECAIIRSSHGSMNTSRYLLFAPSIREVMTTDLVSFNKNEFVTDVGRKMLNTRYRAYPVVDDYGGIYGFISRFHILNSQSKRLVLVDHNEYSQSVEGIEEAEVLEIIDHHRIGDISTVRPIYFRNEVIGSTASIIAKMFFEREIGIPQDLAALMLGAIISDTMNLTSPTTTAQDLEIVRKLESISGLEHHRFARDMYRATSNLKGKTYEEIIDQDIKKFYIANKEVMVSQVVVYDYSLIEGIDENFETSMEMFVEKHHLDLLVVVFTSITDHSSMLFASGTLKQAVVEAFPVEEGNIFLADVVSRKNQIIPQLSLAISNYVK